MTTYEWFQVIQTIIMAVAAMLVFSVRHSWKHGGSQEAILSRLKNVEETIRHAGDKMSDLTTQVQGMPERLRHEFMPRDELTYRLDDSSTDRQRLWYAITELRERRRAPR